MIKHIQLPAKVPVEIWFTLAMLAVTFGLSVALDLPLIIPSLNSASFVGIHYLLPMVGISIWGLLAFLGQQRQRAWTFAIALPCYIFVLWAHFSIKLWAPMINPSLYDKEFWHIDQLFRPIVELSFVARTFILPIVPIESNFYMIGFIAMFYVSFSYHAVMTPHIFRNLFVAALLFQGLGALSYLPLPAIGPFLYEQGLDFQATMSQHRMLETNGHIVNEGRAWLAANGNSVFTAGLGAMPSLHSGGAFLFFIFAWRHAKVLVPVYALILSFILIAAVSTRWHYLIDIPLGICLAWLSIKLSDRLCGPPTLSSLQIETLPTRVPLAHAP